MAICPERRQPPVGTAHGKFCARRGAVPLGVATGVLVLLAIISLPVAAAQQSSHEKPYALIFGTVFGPDGRLVYGVPVKVRRADQKKILMEATSDHQGEFAFRVPPGPADYLVSADVKTPKPDKKSKHDKKPAAPPAASTLASPSAVPSSSATTTAAAASPAAATSGREVKVHIAGDERADIALHLN